MGRLFVIPTLFFAALSCVSVNGIEGPISSPVYYISYANYKGVDCTWSIRWEQRNPRSYSAWECDTKYTVWILVTDGLKARLAHLEQCTDVEPERVRCWRNSACQIDFVDGTSLVTRLMED